MTTSRFIAKQHVKYYWKVVTHGPRTDTVTDHDVESLADSFWQYEQTPRVI